MKAMNLRNIVLTLFTFCLFFFSNSAKATHTPGFELYFNHLSGASYEVFLVIYRDCSGITVPSTSTVNLACSSNPTFNFSTSLNRISTQALTMLINPANQSACNGGSVFGIEKHTYKATVTLPPCSEWKAYYTFCCRHPSSNVSNSVSASIYIEATANTTLMNSSPEFDESMQPSILVNQPTTINLNAVDPDGDSLYHSLYSPMTTSSTAHLTFNSPYTFQ